MSSLQIANQAEASLENLKTVLYAKKLTLQPLTVIVGSLVDVRKTYCVVNNYWYETTSFLDAISLTFKSFFVFDCEYPEPCKNIWLFIQHSMFNIKLPSERIPLRVNSLVKQVEHVIQQNSKVQLVG